MTTAGWFVTTSKVLPETLSSREITFSLLCFKMKGWSRPWFTILICSSSEYKESFKRVEFLKSKAVFPTDFISTGRVASSTAINSSQSNWRYSSVISL